MHDSSIHNSWFLELIAGGGIFPVVRSPKREAPKGGAQKGGGPKISRFFPFSATIFFHSSLWGSFVDLVVFEAPRRSNVHVLEFSGCRVKPPAAPKPPRFHMTAQKPKRAHLKAPALGKQPTFNEHTSHKTTQDNTIQHNTKQVWL